MLKTNIRKCAKCNNTLNINYLARERCWATYDGYGWLCPIHNPGWSDVMRRPIIKYPILKYKILLKIRKMLGIKTPFENHILTSLTREYY